VKLIAAGPCQRCGQSTVRPGQHPPWCPSCEWNLNSYESDHPAAFGWRWFDKLTYRVAFRQDRSQFRRFGTTLPTRPTASAGRIGLIALSLLLIATGLGCLGFGCWLIVDGFPSWWGLLGLLFVGAALLLRPRAGRLPKPASRLRREQAPSLFALVERVAEHVGTRAPEIIVLNQDFNAAIGTRGWRRTRVLWLGAPLWLTLDPGMRVAVLAHELGHGVNGDPVRGWLVEPAINTFRRLADGFGGRHTFGESEHRTRHERGAERIGSQLITDPNQRNPNIFVGIAKLVLWAISRFFMFVHLAIVAVLARDHQRAEYFADRIATEVAGTDATVAAMDHLMLADEITRSVHYSANALEPAQWQSLARAHRAEAAGQLPERQQLSQREADLWASHPPTGFRMRLAQAWPHREPSLVLTQQASDHIDRDLGFWFARTHRRALGTRTFQPGQRSAPGPNGG
jgi:heat shock protein HtpX